MTTYINVILSSFSNRWPQWSWSYGSWIYNYLCNQCLSPLKVWVQTPFMARCTRKTQGAPVSSTNKTDRHDISEILLKVALNTTSQAKSFSNESSTDNAS